MYVHDVKTESDVMQERYTTIFSRSDSRIIIIQSSHEESFYDVGELSRVGQMYGESLTAGQFTKEERPYAEEESCQQNTNIHMGEEIGPPHMVENVIEELNEEQYEDSMFRAF